MHFTVSRILVLAALVLSGLAICYCYPDSLVFRGVPLGHGSKRSGVVLFDRWRSQPGYYNVVNEGVETYTCVIMDMEGKTVYRFPDGFCHFFADGSMLIMLDRLEEFDPTRMLRWSVRGKYHHDLEVSEDDSEVATLTGQVEKFHGKNTFDGVVHVFKRDGSPSFEWHFLDHMQEFEAAIGRPIDQGPILHGELTVDFNHLNTAQILPVNAAEKTNPAFRHGNILVNCFLNSTIFILDRLSQKIVWSLVLDATADIDGVHFKMGAHSVRLLANGNLFFFANQIYFEDPAQPVSAAIELNPLTQKVIWSYSPPRGVHAESRTWGSAYKLANNHALITFSGAGSAVEVDRGGRVVWEWINPDRDRFGFAKPIYRVERVERERVDEALRGWRDVE